MYGEMVINTLRVGVRYIRTSISA